MENDENKNNSSETTVKSSLGLVSLPERTFEHDLEVGKMYQDFSAELLKLSLAGIGAIGFLITNKNVLIKGSRDFIFISLIAFGTSVGAALLHRYFGPDSLANFLIYNRLVTKLKEDKKNPNEQPEEDFWDAANLYFKGVNKNADRSEKARDTKYIRNFLLKISSWLLFLSGFFLWLGAMFLIWAFKNVIY